MKAFFDSELMVPADQECGQAFTGDFAVKIEETSRQFTWQEDYENVFQDSIDIKLEADLKENAEEDSFFCGEQEGIDLMMKYSQLTKRKPIESMKKKVFSHNSRS